MSRGGKYTYIDLNMSESDDNKLDLHINDAFKALKMRKLSELDIPQLRGKQPNTTMSGRKKSLKVGKYIESFRAHHLKALLNQ